jgi:hypothetical protein
MQMPGVLPGCSVVLSVVDVLRPMSSVVLLVQRSPNSAR